MNRFKKIFLIVAIVTVPAYFAQADGPKDYTPTEIQALRLQVKQRDAQLAQKDFFIAQQNFQAALKALGDEADRVKAENRWPESVLFNQEKLSFADVPAPPVPKGVKPQ